MEFLERILRGKAEPKFDGKGLLPVFRGNSLPLADYCGPLGEISEFGDVEIFSLKKLPASVESPFVTFKLDVKGRNYQDILTKTVHQKHRNMVNRAEREGVQVFKRELKAKYLRAYYSLYVKTMLRLGRVPLPYKAFSVLAELLPEEAELYLAEYEGRFIGGLFVFVFGGRMHIWGNASDRGYVGVNNALYAFAIRRACELGLSEVDFGSSAVNSTHYFFKERWGCEAVPIWYRGAHCPDGKAGVLTKVLVAILKIKPVCGVSFISRILHKII